MENGEDNQEDQNEEHSPFVPDLGLPSDESVNHGQGNGAAAAGGAAGGGEAPLSFRRFLEPAGPVNLGRPDVAAGLPDFVQDHLAPAAVAVAARDARGWQPPAAAATGTRRKVPSSGSSSAAGGAAPLPAGQPLGLPDFLSDGPMGTLHSASDGPEPPVLQSGDGETNGPRLRAARAAAESTLQRIQRLERENACLRRDVDRLQQQLHIERRRSGSLQARLDGDAAAAAAVPAPPAAAPAAPAAEGGDSRLQEEVRSLRSQNAELRRRAGSSQLEAATATTELLISQLTSGLGSLRSISDSLAAAAASAPGDGPDLDRPPSGDPPC